MATTSYEAIRLENIRKNEIFLKSLGLDDLKRSVRLESDSDKGKSGQKRKRYHNDRESDMYFMDGDDKSAIPTRRSSRLLGEKALDIDLDKVRIEGIATYVTQFLYLTNHIVIVIYT